MDNIYHLVAALQAECAEPREVVEVIASFDTVAFADWWQRVAPG